MGWVLPAGLAVAGSALPACGGDTSSAGACAIPGCGGDLEGTWDVTAACAKATGSSMTSVPACDSVAAGALASETFDTGALQITFSNGSYTQTGVVHMKVHYVYTNDCLTTQGGESASDASCATVATDLTAAGFPATCRFSGETCSCDAATDVIANNSGTYRISGTNLLYDADGAGSPFCVRGDTAQVSAPGGAPFKGPLTLTRRP